MSSLHPVREKKAVGEYHPHANHGGPTASARSYDTDMVVPHCPVIFATLQNKGFLPIVKRQEITCKTDAVR